MKIYVVDPLTYARWDELVAQHPKASVFQHEDGSKRCNLVMATIRSC